MSGLMKKAWPLYMSGLIGVPSVYVGSKEEGVASTYDLYISCLIKCSHCVSPTANKAWPLSMFVQYDVRVGQSS